MRYILTSYYYNKSVFSLHSLIIRCCFALPSVTLWFDGNRSYFYNMSPSGVLGLILRDIASLKLG